MVAFPKKNGKEKGLAEESLKTKKAREKLKRRLEMMDEKMTKEALDRKSIEIHRWISRHAEKRTPLKNKSIALFDENQHAAEVSLKIVSLAKKFEMGKDLSE